MGCRCPCKFLDNLLTSHPTTGLGCSEEEKKYLEKKKQKNVLLEVPKFLLLFPI